LKCSWGTFYFTYDAPGAIQLAPPRKQPSTFKPNGASRPAPSFPHQHPTPVTICQYRARTRAPRTSHLGRPSVTVQDGRHRTALTVPPPEITLSHDPVGLFGLSPNRRTRPCGRCRVPRQRSYVATLWGPVWKVSGKSPGGGGPRTAQPEPPAPRGRDRSAATARFRYRRRYISALIADCPRDSRVTNRTYIDSITNCSRQGQRPQSTESTHGPTHWTLQPHVPDNTSRDDTIPRSSCTARHAWRSLCCPHRTARVRTHTPTDTCTLLESMYAHHS
jgi:hypothetical protein